MPVRGADAIRSRIAAADHHHMLVLGGEGALRGSAGFVIARHALVLLGEEIHREMNAVHLAANHIQIARIFRPARHYERIVILEQHRHRNGRAHFHTRAERNAFRLHLAHPPVDQMLFHLEVGNAIAQQPADAIALFEHRHAVARARQLLRASQPRGAGAHNGDVLACLLLGQLRGDPAFFPAAIHDLAFDGFDRHRLFDDVERAGSLARGRAHAAGEFRKIVGGMQRVEGASPLVAVDEVVPVRDHIVDRATRVAERNTAIHATRGLLAQFAIGQRRHEFAKVLAPRLGLFIAAIVPFDLQKARGFSHGPNSS